jgi:hypothetical protein
MSSPLGRSLCSQQVKQLLNCFHLNCNVVWSRFRYLSFGMSTVLMWVQIESPQNSPLTWPLKTKILNPPLWLHVHIIQEAQVHKLLHESIHGILFTTLQLVHQMGFFTNTPPRFSKYSPSSCLLVGFDFGSVLVLPPQMIRTLLTSALTCLPSGLRFPHPSAAAMQIDHGWKMSRDHCKQLCRWVLQRGTDSHLVSHSREGHGHIGGREMENERGGQHDSWFVEDHERR